MISLRFMYLSLRGGGVKMGGGSLPVRVIEACSEGGLDLRLLVSHVHDVLTI